MKMNEFESTRKKVIALKQVMVTPLLIIYCKDTDRCDSSVEIYFAVYYRIIL
jgi:hypothetical protein